MQQDFSKIKKRFDMMICGGGIYGPWTTTYNAALTAQLESGYCRPE